MEKRLMWAYLDDVDITLALKPDVTHEDVLEHLSQEDVRERYGLEVNVGSSWFISHSDLLAIGHKLLGSWIGGPYDDTSGSLELISEAVEKLKFAIPILRRMPLQHALLLLRMCFYPILNHLFAHLASLIKKKKNYTLSHM